MTLKKTLNVWHYFINQLLSFLLCTVSSTNIWVTLKILSEKLNMPNKNKYSWLHLLFSRHVESFLTHTIARWTCLDNISMLKTYLSSGFGLPQCVLSIIVEVLHLCSKYMCSRIRLCLVINNDLWISLLLHSSWGDSFPLQAKTS